MTYIHTVLMYNIVGQQECHACYNEEQANFLLHSSALKGDGALRAKTIRVWIVASACLFLIIFLAVSADMTDYKAVVIDSLYLECKANGKNIELSLWEDETEGKYYLFLPSWFSGRESEIIWHYANGIGTIQIDGTPYTAGSSWQENGQEETHSFEIEGRWGGQLLSSTLQVLASENLPSVFVTVEDKDDLISDVEFANKQYLESGYVEIRNETGELLCREKLIRFKVRGNLTATLDKKPFSFSFREPVSVLGMNPGIKWNLIANAMDGSHIRNKIIRDLALESIDAYEPQGEFAELYLNGQYQGLYLITEAVEIGENRLEISEKDNWFIEMELDFRAREDPTQIITDRGQIFIVHSDTAVSEIEKQEIRKRLNDVESALFAENGISEASGRPLRELIDLESFAEAWLVEELSGDHDIGITSQFMYAGKYEDALWYAGPVWDFDGSMANVNTPMYAVPEALTGVVAMTRPEDNNNQNRWLSAMYRHVEFQTLVQEKYKEIFRENYKGILEQRIDRYAETIGRSALLDAFRWHKWRLGWWFVRPEGLEIPDTDNYDRFDTLELSIEIVEDFMSRKIEFLDKLWIEGKDFCVVEVRNPAPFLDQGYEQTLYYWVERGAAIQNLPEYEDQGYRFEGYYDIYSHELISNGSMIGENRVLEGIWTQVGAG